MIIKRNFHASRLMPFKIHDKTTFLNLPSINSYKISPICLIYFICYYIYRTSIRTNGKG